MLTAIGHLRDSGRAVFVAETDRIEELPKLISLPCSRFVLLLAYAHGREPARLTEAMRFLLDGGCVYLCAWGPGCEHVHDTMDDAVLGWELAGGPEQVIMTTWHDGVPLGEALHFALGHAVPHDALVHGCDAVVLAAVRNSEWAEDLRRLATQYLAPVR
jgi:hypothetical protein